MPDKISFLFLGDVIGRPGRKALKKYLRSFVEKYSPSLVIANGENAAGGIGITEEIGRELLNHVDVLTSGNHIWDKREAESYLDREPRLIRPANYPPKNPGNGTYIFESEEGKKVGVLNLQGRVFMDPIDCPFRVADEEIKRLKEATSVVIVDFHAEATSEKQAMGWYLDGKVSAVVGTHTHVTTADERILPQGTAFITDVGMVGGFDSVIGIRSELAIKRFLTGRPQRLEPAKAGLLFSALFVEVDEESGRALSIKREIIKEEESG
ncbi:MAG: TIGR00282 family metallophosphoesterase [Candidatus Aminicenantes bacterium]|nr:MAG: TIGR00282 family metallophosphoesterase [Candidatus Aminicenantes bacterium]